MSRRGGVRAWIVVLAMCTVVALFAPTAPAIPGRAESRHLGLVDVVDRTGSPDDPGTADNAREWMLPVRAEVVDHFRAPLTDWGPGNRGWEFGTVGGEAVVAVGSGTVRFAGWVAGRAAVTIDHGDGLLSSVTGLSAVRVAAGRHVPRGDPIGVAMAALHLGFRRDGRYIDPELLYRRPVHAVLVPVPGGSPAN